MAILKATKKLTLSDILQLKRSITLGNIQFKQLTKKSLEPNNHTLRDAFTKFDLRNKSTVSNAND